MPTHLCRFTVRAAMGTHTGFSWCSVCAIRFSRSLHVPLRDCHFQSATALPKHVPSMLNHSRCRNIDLLTIVYALRPRLRSRLTLGGRPLPRKPWVYGGQGSHLSYRYSCLHPHLLALHRSLRLGFNAPTTLPYHAPMANHWNIQSFGISLIANHFRRRITR